MLCVKGIKIKRKEESTIVLFDFLWYSHHIRASGGAVLFVLIMCFMGCAFVYSADVAVDTYIPLQSVRSLQYGFKYRTMRDEEVDERMLADIESCQSASGLSASGLYRGQCVCPRQPKAHETVHFSREHESKLNVRFIASFLFQKFGRSTDEYTYYVSLEDAPGFLYLYEHLHVGSMTRGALKHDFSQVFEGHFGEPMAFLSSGKDGFRSAGEFLYHLRKDAVWEDNPRVVFLTTAVQLRGRKNIEARQAIAYAAAQVDGDPISEWFSAFDKCTDYVACQKVWPDHVVLSQDVDNVFCAYKPLEAYETLKKEGVQDTDNVDVLLGEVTNCTYDGSYRQSAHMLYTELSQKFCVGHVLGTENPCDLLPRAQHTLVCVTHKDFADSEGFGRSIAQNFNYKNVIFIQCGYRASHNQGLVVGGTLERTVLEPSVDVAFQVLYPGKNTGA